ncbi:NAD(P)-binding protein, partial [Aspergillus lucknowensis]
MFILSNGTMATADKFKVLVIGGTGAQGLPVVRGLVNDKKYTCRILTRNPKSARAQSLLALGNVELFEGSFVNEADLCKAYEGCDRAFVNIDGFNVGEKGEMYWAIRTFELALENGGIRFFVYGNLDYGYKKSGYSPEFRTGHYDGKGRIGEWILSQSKSTHMGAALFTTGPYLEMAISERTPMAPVLEKDEKSGEDVLTWRVPLTDEGAVPHVALDDCGPYVRWLFDNPSRANGLNLEVAVEHVHYHDLARAFTKVTGKPARFIDVDFDTYWATGPMAYNQARPAAYSVPRDDLGVMTVRENFTGFWTLWRNSGGNRGVIRRNYQLLDEIHPNRIKSAEEWFRREDEKGRNDGRGSLWDRVQNGNRRYILKNHEDFLLPKQQANI